MKIHTEDDDLITVCSECLQASCWQAILFCEKADSAGVVQKTRRELKALNLEHPSYWKTDSVLTEL